MNNRQKTFEIREASDGKLYFRGYATVETWDGEYVIDDYGTIIKSVSAEEAITEAMDHYVKTGSILYNHDPDFVIGKPVSWSIDENGVILEGVLDTPITDEEKSVWNKIKNGSITGLSIRFGSDYTVSTIKVGGEEVYVLNIKRIVEISITPIPANPKTIIMETFVRSLNLKRKQPMKEEVKMENKNITITLDEYRRYIKAEAELELLKSKIDENERKVKDAVKTAEEMKAKLERAANPEEIEQLKNDLNAKEIEIENLRAAKEELEKEINTIKERSVDWDISDKLNKQTKAFVADSPVERAIKSLNEKNYNELVADYIYHETKENKSERAIINKRLVYLYHLEKMGVEVKPDEFHQRTITTDDILLKNPAVDTSIVDNSVLTPNNFLDIIPTESINSNEFKWERRVGRNVAKFDSEDAIVEAGDNVYKTESGKVKYLYIGGKVSDPADRFSAVSALSKEIGANTRSLRDRVLWGLIYGNEDLNPYEFDGAFTVALKNNGVAGGFLSGTVLNLDELDRFFGTYENNVNSENILPDVLLVDSNTYRLIKKLYRDYYKGVYQSTVTINGIKHKVLDWDGCIIVNMKMLVATTAGIATPSFSASAAAGGSLPDGDYTVKMDAITRYGRTYSLGGGATATLSSPNSTLQIDINMEDYVDYVNIFIKAPGESQFFLKKQVRNTVGSGAQSVSITKPEDMMSGVNLPPLESNHGMIMALQIGGDDGLSIKMAADAEYVKKGRVGNFTEFYLRSYLTAIFRNPKAVLMDHVIRS